MDRRDSAGWRLFGCGIPPATDGPSPPRLLDDNGCTRALVLALKQPADWTVLGRVWQRLQHEAALPAPAIAVAGQDGLQLWFSLAQPVSAAEGAALLTAVQEACLPDVAPARLQHWPVADARAASGWRHAPHWPGEAMAEEHWSAFVAPDLAPVFGAEPWLDVAPSADGQADLLAPLRSMAVADLAEVLARWQPPVPPPASSAGLTSTAAPAVPASTPPAVAGNATTAPALAGPFADARQFLLAVVNDPSSPLPLRIDAAKALLAQPERTPPG